MSISRNSTISTLIILLLFAGCASNPSITSLRPEQRARLNTIKIFKRGVNRPYKILGSVEGLSCRRNAHQRKAPTKHEAIEGVRLEAAILEADAVINTACQVNSEPDWRNNCWSSVVCVGDAIKYKN
ncbi:MAG: hypothetical protein GY710_26870 [Desulfobacteraceae bacterium]|nr:hypothetical protein [Desulfobacteraceae bacterium]